MTRTNMQETSLEAYNLIQNLNEKEGKVYRAIGILQPCTDQMVADHFKVSINRITGRRNSLVKFGLIIKAGEIRNKYNRRSITWQHATKSMQVKLFENQKLESNDAVKGRTYQV